MANRQHYLTAHQAPVVAIIKGMDRDVEHGEDIVMLGFGLVMMAPLFAPVAPPSVVLPAMALTFLVCSIWARLHFYSMHRRLAASLAQLTEREHWMLKGLSAVFESLPEQTMQQTFNPLHNWKRSLRSTLGGLLINPYWMPIFYGMAVHVIEDKQLFVLNKAVMNLERRYLPSESSD
jgi:hypothetical protein